MEKLAINGGEPVRKYPFPTNMLGASTIGFEELKELSDVCEAKSPFRFYGIGVPTKVKTFEELFCKRLECKYALGVASGTAALMCAVAAGGFGPGDEIIIPSFAWHSDYMAVVLMGATPVFADIGDDLNMDPDSFEKRITPKTKAVIVVHYQGHPARIDEIVAIAKKHNIVVIEDVAQALGGTYKGKLLGSYGDMAISSFQTHKVLTCGEGGVFFTNNEDYYVRAIRYHDLGNVRPFFKERMEHPEKGDNALKFAGAQLRMSELSGAFLCAQIRKLDMILGKTRNIHDRLRRHLENNPNFKIRYREGDCGIAFILLMNTAEDAKRLTEAMVAEGIPMGPTSFCCNLIEEYPIKTKQMPNSNMDPFGPGCDGEDIVFDSAVMAPNTDDYAARFVAIGIGPQYTDQEVDDIIMAFDKVLPEFFD